MTFRPGQLVICINDSFNFNTFDPDAILPIKDSVYRIRETFVRDGKPQLRLCEIRNPVREYLSGRYECSFHPSRFRPIAKRKTDISIFKKMETPSRSRAKENAS